MRLLLSGRYLRFTVSLWLMELCAGAFLYGLSTWLPSVLEQKGIGLLGSLTYTAVITFGQSSGRAIATRALRATGIGCVAAETFTRTFYRNCFEVGLPAIEVPGVKEIVTAGDRLRVDLAAGTATNPATGATCSGTPADPFLMDMLDAGGLIALARRHSELFRG
ncbi:hypothetical protein [Streptomyces tremellae]|uniref:3-isopropylmalate dehydratase small subunit n=1 Tax=Streptomyces tremellae TaxID=1124239 RepID=A0ABP7EZF9_9ACTN